MTAFPEIFSVNSITAAITSIFLAVIISYYALLLLPSRKPKPEKKFASITVIIPAHNEERYIEESVASVLRAEFDGKKDVIVIDDGSTDSTYQKAAAFGKGIKLIRTPHNGKSASLNRALLAAKGELVAVVDGDSVIQEDALKEMAIEAGRENVAAASCVVKVKNRKTFLGMWLHMEQLYNSMMRLVLSKVNANVTTPGPLSVYRRKELMDIGGFSTEGYSEDIDVTIRLIRKGHRVGFSEKAMSQTNMPVDLKGFFRQRNRFAGGILNILKRHLKMNKTAIDLYTLPIFLFSYVQAVILGAITLHQIISGYVTYFASSGNYLSAGVLKFLFDWFSIVGFARWSASVLTGASPLTAVAAVGILSTFLSYPLFALAILKFDKKIDAWHVIPFAFMFPFWLLIMIVYTANVPEYFKKNQYNRWKKNES